MRHLKQSSQGPTLQTRPLSASAVSGLSPTPPRALELDAQRVPLLHSPRHRTMTAVLAAVPRVSTEMAENTAAFLFAICTPWSKAVASLKIERATPPTPG